MEKFCKSCGMPMDKPEDFANNDRGSNYCYYCGDKPATYNKEEIYKEQTLKKEEYYNKKTKKKPTKKKIKKKK
tara:strand:- start:51 stop:269 length:219 start_codon:yes stop_codon:yes gene_type:complete